VGWLVAVLFVPFAQASLISALKLVKKHLLHMEGTLLAGITGCFGRFSADAGIGKVERL
jgi:hypothetical protein